ncbi:MAG: hypothetical protein ACKV19_23570 [Verrucomicrobiales bacterium]
MTLPELLHSLSDEERDFISKADYGRESELHRKALDSLISRNGVVDLDSEIWYPYEVIELTKNSLVRGHAREFSACLGIVIANVNSGADNRNDLDLLRGIFSNSLAKLPDSLAEILADILAAPQQQAEHAGDGKPDPASS